MHLDIKGFPDLRARLRSVDPAEIASRALAEQAERLAQAVRDRLSEPEGAGAHATPWLRTGALRDSITATSEGFEATVGSNDPAAAPQEMGTAHLPPRPFLAPTAAAQGEAIAGAVGKQVADALIRPSPGSASPE